MIGFTMVEEVVASVVGFLMQVKGLATNAHSWGNKHKARCH